MLTISISTSPEQAISYHTQDQARENYYSNVQEMPGRWGGKGAERLGLHGNSTTADFERLCYNLHPETGEQLSPRMKENRRVGYDFTFSAPKSVSLLYEWTNDQRILQVFDRAWEKAMEIVEQHAATRVRMGGRDEDRPTKELLWAAFKHFTARPEDGRPDMQLHEHVYVFNETFDPVEKRWKAVQVGDIKTDAEHYQSIWLSEFSKGLAELGYEIVPTGKFFEIGGISRSLIEKFSKRTTTIHKKAEELGITDKDEIAKLGVMTREKKVKDLTREQLHAHWWEQLTPEDELQLNAAAKNAQRSIGIETPGPNLERAAGTRSAECYVEPSKWDLQAVKFAVEHVFERASVVRERELISEALQWGYGKATLYGVTNAIRDWPLIRGKKNGQTILTTKEVLAEENRIVARCKAGKEQESAMNPDWKIQDERLGSQQRDAVFHILRSKDFITGVVGKSGAGKTTALQEAARGLEAEGKKVMAFAPTAEASRGNLREAGFAEAETVAKLLSNTALQNQARGAVWFVDEGGLMSARVTDEFLALADKLRARVFIIGDAGQHHSVERGDAFRLLQELGEMSVVTVDEIQRQKGNYKRVVELISEHKCVEALDLHEEMGCLHEMPFHERQAAIAKRFLELNHKRKDVLVLSPTHNECEKVTDAIREALKESQDLGDGQKIEVLRSLSWTAAQRRDARGYEKGMVVQVNQHHRGFSLGERLEVVEVANGEVKARGKYGVKTLPLFRPKAFEVYEKGPLEVCEGDRIRITANGRTEDRHRVNNGDTHRVRGFSPEGDIILKNGWRLGRDFAHIDYGYASTSHAAQGKTVDWVLVAQSAQCSSGAADTNQFYVSISRGREGAETFTDSIELLREDVARVRERMHAMELSAEEEPIAQAMERSVPELGEHTEVGAVNLTGLKLTAEERERLANIRERMQAAEKNAEEKKSSRELGEYTELPEVHPPESEPEEREREEHKPKSIKEIEAEKENAKLTAQFGTEGPGQVNWAVDIPPSKPKAPKLERERELEKEREMEKEMDLEMDLEMEMD